ncbi:hypothetical protein CPC16_006158 [Podila verticillata]|nr:hypothetical protein BGZ59_005133 [Podila verticillata]KAF9388910.1 hypothetical protein CPC16_006158 [Podila verticillata]KAI9236185.1 MAG: hypothetical protein BYD32DRAFT_31387 [Podila humilis]KFH69031.1 hypothetical protein MVEG_05833 [Podila verticillata NRRL 6337]
MHKLTVLLVTLASVVVAAPDTYKLYLQNNAGKSTFLEVPIYTGERWCYCLSKTQTSKIDGRSAGDVKLFSTTDCTGNYATGTGKVTSNAQWVNSVSFGKGGIPSDNFITRCSWWD